MLGRVVSNFRKKARSTRKSLKTSFSSPEIKTNACKSRHSGRTFSEEFDFDGEVNLSICDKTADSEQNKSLESSGDKPETSDSGANRSRKINIIGNRF